MCQYDTDAPAQGHPHPHAGILQQDLSPYRIARLILHILFLEISKSVTLILTWPVCVCVCGWGGGGWGGGAGVGW